jgi:predicted mannosyl-3-phosphoglycerate phosphatase (HAD superfamily)
MAVFTAMDGTLLDGRSFEPGVALGLVQRLHEMEIPVVPVTVMTLDEIAPIAAELGMRHAMIIEAGGAIARWDGAGWQLEPTGPSPETLLDVIREIEERSGANLLVYSALPQSLAAQVSGRSGPMLEASTRRSFSEPFVIESGEIADVVEAAAVIGFSIRQGRRFLHLCRGGDEAFLVSRLREELRCDFAIGAGGSPLDAEFLVRCDEAIVIPDANGTADPDLVARIPARIARHPAPEGWAMAVSEAIQDHTRTPQRQTRS